MRKLLVTTTVILLGLGLAGAAAAAQLKFSGTIGSKLGARRINSVMATGIATVNMSGGGGLLHTLRLPGSIAGSNFAPVTDPDTSGTIKTVGFIGTAMTGTLADFQNPPLTSNKVLLKGISRLCLLQACPFLELDIPLSANDGHTGVGIGGLLTGNLGIGGGTSVSRSRPRPGPLAAAPRSTRPGRAASRR